MEIETKYYFMNESECKYLSYEYCILVMLNYNNNNNNNMEYAELRICRARCVAFYILRSILQSIRTDCAVAILMEMCANEHLPNWKNWTGA